jgi:dihydropyrimidinase
MTYDDLKLDDGQILDVLSVAREHGAMAMIHAENADCIEWLTRRLEAAGRTAPRFHAQARPMLVEREATHRAITLAELVDVPILVVHVSGREAVQQIRWAARAHGLRCLPRPARSTCFSPPTTWASTTATRAHAACAARRRATRPTSR